MRQIPLHTVAQYAPSHDSVRTAVARMGMEAEFVDGTYQRVFFGLRGYAMPGAEQAWAQAYVRNYRVLEYAAQESFAMTGLSRDEARHLTLAVAGKHAKMSVAGAATGMAPCYEDFLDERASGHFPRNPGLATTARQVSSIRAALALAGPRFPLLLALDQAKSVEGFMLYVLASVLHPDRDVFAYDEEGLVPVPESVPQYRTAVYRWLGRSHDAALSAIQFAKAGALPNDIRSYADSGLAVEYAAALF